MDDPLVPPTDAPEPLVPNPEVTPAPETASPAAAPPPTPAPIFARLAPEDMQLMAAGIVQGLSQASQAMRGPAVAAPIDDVSDADIEAAIQRGESAAPLIRRAANAAAERVRRDLAGQFDAFRSQGTAALASMARSTLNSQKHYAKYKAEIDGAIASLPPEAQANPDVLLNAYKYIVGTHVDEIEAAASERSIRQAREAAPTVPAGGTRGSRSGPTLDPDVLITDEATRQAAKEMGGYEKVARMQGYDDVQTWLKELWTQ